MAVALVGISALAPLRMNREDTHVKTILAIVLIGIGIMGLAYGGISYWSPKTFNLGPIHASTTTKETIPISPIVGGLALAGGVVLFMSGRR